MAKPIRDASLCSSVERAGRGHVAFISQGSKGITILRRQSGRCRLDATMKPSDLLGYRSRSRSAIPHDAVLTAPRSALKRRGACRPVANGIEWLAACRSRSTGSAKSRGCSMRHPTQIRRWLAWRAHDPVDADLAQTGLAGEGQIKLLLAITQSLGGLLIRFLPGGMIARLALGLVNNWRAVAIVAPRARHFRLRAAVGIPRRLHAGENAGFAKGRTSCTGHRRGQREAGSRRGQD